MRVLHRILTGCALPLITPATLPCGLHPQCSLVVAADPPPHVTAYIQCRGRARQQGSHYVLMQPALAKAKRKADLPE